MLIYPVIGITVEQLRTLIKLEWPKMQEGWKGILAAADIQTTVCFRDLYSLFYQNTYPIKSKESFRVMPIE